MRLPVEWILEHAPAGTDAEETSRLLTMAGFEIEEIEESAQGPVLNIKVTPNRGDGLSVVGVARELAAACRIDRSPLVVANTDHAAIDGVKVTIEAPDLCPRYAARLVRNIAAKPSPTWMQARLEASGMRPINGIVDVTNYVMLETGQPLHAFDYDTLHGGAIVVRCARAGETITTLDGNERQLTADMLMICDADHPVAVAGVMGGAETEMTDATSTMLLESAHFNPISIRRTSRALDLRTEASYRFERTVDPENVALAADRACQLIAELGLGDVVPGIVDVYPSPSPRRELSVRPARVSLLLGFQVMGNQIVDSLGSLGFELAGGEEATLRFAVPSWRPDIVREVDLAEEVGRVLGYEHIPEKLPFGSTTQGGDTASGRFAEKIRALLVGAGLQEIVTHSLLAPGELEDPRDAEARVAIRSALSIDLSGLRRSLLPGLVETIERNARRGQSPLALFEIGRVFRWMPDGSHSETQAVGGALAGPMVASSWQRDSRQGPCDFYTARGLVERLADGLGLKAMAFDTSSDPRLHPGRSATILLNGKEMGWIGELHPTLAAELNVKDRILAFELSLDALYKAALSGPGFTPLSPYQSVTRDLAPRVPSHIPYLKAHRAVESVSSSILESFELTDVFTGSPLPDGVKALTLSFTFRAQDRTLTETEVNDALVLLRDALEKQCEASFAG